MAVVEARFIVWFGRRGRGGDASGHWWPHLLVWTLLTVYSFRQRWGQTTFDTKLDLTVDPGGFLERTLTAWNPMSAFGELQNQAYGYIFPHGLFFVGADRIGLPDWVAQRLWSALLLIVAYEGARRLFAAIDHERARSWLPLVAGLAFALSPRLLGLSGALTGEIHPSAMLPWVVLPLVLALRGVLTPLHGAAWSGVAILLMGGVNASEVLLALVLPGLLVLCSVGTTVGRRLLVWWPLSVVAATIWWVTGLLIQGRYAPPFLDYIETAAATTQPLGWTNVVRGANHWLSFIWAGGRPWWEGSHQLATDGWLVLLTGLVAAISLYGLFHRSMPWRLPFALGALVAALLLTLGHVDVLGSPLDSTFRQLLDGVLSPFRNIHKLDPVMRLPMALGFAHAVGLLAARVHELLTTRVAREHGTKVRVVVVLVACALLFLSGRPLFTDDLRKQGWEEIPAAWYEAAEFLEENSGQGRALVVPGSGFGQQTWGWTIDEPLQPLAGAPWVSRSQVPLTPGATIRYLDSIEERIQDGVGSPVLADALARAGIKHVLVRRDLDTWATESPSPARVDLALRQSPGLEKVASFGAPESGGAAMIDIFEVDRNVPLLEAVDLTAVKTLAGGPEDAMTAMEAGLLRPGEVTVNASEDGWDARPDVVGDGFRRRERQFGRVVDAVSQVMTEGEDFRTARRTHDYAGVSEDDRVVARYASLSAVVASSSDGYVDSFGAIKPEHGPSSAVDGTAETYWRSAPLESPVGQWLELQFADPEPLREMRLVAGVDLRSGAPIRRVRIDVGNRTYERGIDPGNGEVFLPLTGAPVKEVRITVLDVFGDPVYAQVAIREVSFEGVDLTRSLVLPESGATGETSFVFRARPPRRGCLELGAGPQCDTGSARASEEENGLNRDFTTTAAGRFQVRAKVVARSTEGAVQLLDPYPNQVRARATSVAGWDPAVAGQRAMDGDATTAWVAAAGDPSPALELEWGEERTIDSLSYEPALFQGSVPTRAIIETVGGESREVDLRQGSISLGTFEPLTTSKVRVTFPMRVASPSGEALAPLAIGEVKIGGLERAVAPWSPDQRTGSVCGYGPEVALDGVEYPTRVVGTMDDVVGGRPLALELCDDDPIDLDAGSHELRVTSTDQYTTTEFVLEPDGGGPDEAEEVVRGREVGIVDWGATKRVVRVGAGADSVLRIPENVNAGWRATLEGEELEPLRLDSWQQGFRLPAGAGGEVTLEFVPDETYRLQMYLGALVALALFALVVVLELRRRGPVGRGTTLPRWLARGRAARWAAVPLAYLLGGVPLLVGVLGALWLLGRRRDVGGLATAVVMVAVLAQAVSAWRGDGVNVGWADWVAGAAVGLWAMMLVGPGKGE